ncbi:MAG: Holliday junction branch migration protein RuvA [Micrococcales bacterium]
MIASLRGEVQSRAGSSIVLEVSGVGYLVQVPISLSSTASIGQEVLLHTAQIVREDSSQLFGFEHDEERALFDLLRSVTGVGPKTALAIISTLSPAEISQAVTTENSKPFESVTGVGVKTAKLINVTLAGKLKPNSKSGNPLEIDLLSALQSLGWTERVAQPVVQSVMASAGQKDISVLIRECLSVLGK